MLIVKSSCSGARSLSMTASVSATGTSSSRSIETDRSRSRYGTLVGSVIPARELVLVVGVEDRLAAHREVAPLRMALVVLGHQDPAVVRVAVEDHAEHVVDLALLVVGRRPLRRDAGNMRVVERHARAHADAVHRGHVEQLVVHAE